MGTDLKRCPRCEVERSTEQYGKDKSRRDGLTSNCKPCRAEIYRLWAASDSGKASVRAAQKRYINAHRERQREAVRKWHADHPGYSAEANRKWREANPGATAAYHRANREKTMERVNRRRRAKAETTFGPVDLEALWTGDCGICTTPIDRALRHPDPLSPSIDHIVPLSKGGTHEQRNLQWTHLVCNLKKGAVAPVSASSAAR